MLLDLSGPPDEGRTGDDGVFSDETERGTGGQGGGPIGTQSSTPAAGTTVPGGAADPAAGGNGELTGVGGDGPLPGDPGTGGAGTGAGGTGGSTGTGGTGTGGTGTGTGAGTTGGSDTGTSGGDGTGSNGSGDQTQNPPPPSGDDDDCLCENLPNVPPPPITAPDLGGTLDGVTGGLGLGG